MLHNLVKGSFDLFRYLILGDQLKPWELHFYCFHIRSALGVTCDSFTGAAYSEQMLLETRGLLDATLDARVSMAKSANRLARLDNPILYQRLKDLKRKAEAALAAADAEE